MIHLRLFLVITAFCGMLGTAHAAALFGGPKTLSDDGTYNDNSGEQSEMGSPNHRGSYIAPTNGTCEVGCKSGSQVQVDIKKRCMCISGYKCFTIDIGHGGPGSETKNGVTRMRIPNGGNSYQTTPGPGTTTYDKDAISTGNPGNDSPGGKWLHKSRRCGAEGDKTKGGRSNTAGCVGVPCAYWPKLKSMAAQGASLEICNGSPYTTSVKCSGPGRRCGNDASGAAAKGRSRSGRN